MDLAKAMNGGNSWTIQDSTETYNIRNWGKGYFGINTDGHVLSFGQDSGTPRTRLVVRPRQITIAIRVQVGIQIDRPGQMIAQLAARGADYNSCVVESEPEDKSDGPPRRRAPKLESANSN